MHRFERRWERFRPVPQDRWKENDPESGGLLLDLGAHLVDSAVQLFGPVEQVYAELHARTTPAVDDVFLALVHAGDGVVSHLQAGGVVGAPGPRTRVLGDKGAFLVTSFEGEPTPFAALDDAYEETRRPGEPVHEGWLVRGADRQPVPRRARRARRPLPRGRAVGRRRWTRARSTRPTPPGRPGSSTPPWCPRRSAGWSASPEGLWTTADAPSPTGLGWPAWTGSSCRPMWSVPSGTPGSVAVEAAGHGWLAVAADGSDRRIELHVVSGVLDEERSARLRAVRHEHLPQVLDVVELSAGRLGLVVEHVLGLTLGQIRAARAPLTDGEAATVTIPVAGALDALHDAGLGHGAVSGSTIVVRPDGRPVLTDLRGALAGADDVESDLRCLVTTVLAQMPSADVHLVSDVADQGTLRDVLTDLLTVPGLVGAQVVDGCFRAATPTPVRLPDAGALVSSALTAGARVPAPGAVQGSTRREARARRRRRAVRLGIGARGDGGPGGGSRGRVACGRRDRPLRTPLRSAPTIPWRPRSTSARGAPRSSARGTPTRSATSPSPTGPRTGPTRC